MPKRQYIPPKPTTYRGVKYRSKLEARWAVALDNFSNVLHFEYEPKAEGCDYLVETCGLTYTPDFRVRYFHEHDPMATLKIPKPGNLYLEIKPAEVSDDYMELLRDKFSHEIPIFLLTGSFFENRISSSLIYKGVLYAVSILHIFPYPHVLLLASNYRFDLKE